MRKKHTFKDTLEFRCPFETCGKEIIKRITVEYVTNQRGDVIEHRIK